ncbi:MAG: Lrp/AsnC family transcriptional regulator [Hahellaceae bacterium]|nr:Lrp/AsnC family transcriptional regulator [Hahellaceae bacterium]MCP5169696.1 Lrp/AsnC family transcriptional regulator [Hahellaceae bacterium]
MESPNESPSFQASRIDRELIRLTQEGLPLCPHPYHKLGEQLGLSADEVMCRLQRMLDAGVIRRIAAVPNHYRLGYKFNGMTVWNVPDELISELGPRVGELRCVSHCYHRPRHLPHWPYNLFAMVHGRSQDEVDKHIQTIKDLLGEHNRGNEVLFSKRILKKTGLRLAAGG